MTVPSATQTELATTYAQVVVPTDFSPLSWRVLTLATRMSRAFGAPRQVIHVDTASPWLDEGSHSLVVGDGPAGASVGVEVIAARKAADGIVRALGDDEGSLLVMSTHGHAAPAELVTGSTAEDVLRRWHGPILLAGPRYRLAAVPFRRIVLCIDPMSAAVPAELIDDVKGWAARFDVPIEVLVIVEHEPSADFESILRQNERLEAAADAISTDERVAKLVRLEGTHPGRDIARYCDAVDGTLLALATHARRPSARAVLGSTALSVLRHVKSPVLVRRFRRARV